MRGKLSQSVASDLPSALPTPANAEAEGIRSELGDVYELLKVDVFRRHDFLWDKGQIIDLNRLFHPAPARS
jgi:hypothetical protein